MMHGGSQVPPLSTWTDSILKDVKRFQQNFHESTVIMKKTVIIVLGERPWFEILKQVVACSRLREKLREKSADAGGSPISVACKNCFQCLIPVYQLLVYPMIGQQLSRSDSFLTEALPVFRKELTCITIVLYASCWDTGGPSSLCEFKMAVNIKDLYGNSGKRFKSINTR